MGRALGTNRGPRVASVAACLLLFVNTGMAGRPCSASPIRFSDPIRFSESAESACCGKVENVAFSGVAVDGEDVVRTMKTEAPGTSEVRAPVVLVHGVGGNPWVTWGFPIVKPSGSAIRDAVVKQKPAGLTRFLLSKGYVMGRTLFAVDWGGTRGLDYVREYKRLMAIIDQAKRVASSDKVDLISSDTAALICRYYLGSEEYRRRNDVRTLVMIGPSNRGLFLANALKEASVVVRQREMESGRRSVSSISPEEYEGYTSIHRGATGADPGSSGTVSGAADPEERAVGEASSTSAPASSSGEFNGMEYVLRRARDLYENLYLEYLLENEILDGGPAKGGSRAFSARSFQAWLAAEHSDVFRTCMLENQIPPAGPALKGAAVLPAQPPRDGQVLTGAYYENLAMLAGKAACLRRMGNDESLLDRLLEHPFVSMDYKQMLAHYGSIVARYLLERLWDVAKHVGGSFALKQVEEALRIEDPTVVDRLTEEKFLYPVGTDPGGREKVMALKGNHFLELVNNLDSNVRSGYPGTNPTRYVIVAGKTLNVLSWVWPGVEENDTFVSLKSTYIPLALKDSFKVFAGVVYGSHHGLTYNPNVWEYVLKTLSANPNSKEYRVGYEAPAVMGTLRASLWEPTYALLDIIGRRPSDYLIIEVSSTAKTGYTGGVPGADGAVIAPDDEALKDLKLEAWLESEDGAILERGYCARTGSPANPEEDYEERWVTTAGANPGKAITLRLPATRVPGKVKLGVKLACDSISANAFEEYLALAPTTVKFTARVVKETQEETRGEHGPWTPESTFPVSPGEGGEGDRTGNVEAGPGMGENAGGSGALPIIVAKYRTKRTTTVSQRVFAHERWEWDFGDGGTFTVSGEGTQQSRVVHKFEKPGTYEVTATSISTDGRTLRRAKWMVTVSGEGTTEGGLSDPTGNANGGSERANRKEVRLKPGETHEFEAITVKPPSVTVRVHGPAEWVTGRPARFDVELDMSQPDFCVSQSVTRVYPGEAFLVVWERPGRYDVEAAVTVKTTYSFEDQRLTLYNTYVGRTSVNVLASGISD